MFEQRLCLACNDPLPISKRLGAQYCSRDCKHAADATAKRLARFQSHNLRSRELAVATTTYKLWLLGFQREVVERAPRFARGYQLGAPIRGGNLFWFPSSSGAKGRKRRRTLTLSWAKAVEYFSLAPFEQPWIPKAGFYRLRYVVGDEAQPQSCDEYHNIRIPYGVPLWDLAFDADELVTERS